MIDQDATVVTRLREAGAVLVAKLSMVEIAGGMGYRQANASLTGPGPEPVGYVAVERRQLVGLGLGGGGGTGAVRDRVGDDRQHQLAEQPVRPLGPAPDLRPRLARRGHGALVDARQGRPDGPYGLRLRHDPRRHRRPRPRRPLGLRSALPLEGRRAARDASSSSPSSRTVSRTRSRRSASTSSGRSTSSRASRRSRRPRSRTGRAGPVATTILGAEKASAFEEMVDSGEVFGLTAPEDRIGGFAVADDPRDRVPPRPADPRADLPRVRRLARPVRRRPHRGPIGHGREDHRRTRQELPLGLAPPRRQRLRHPRADAADRPR